MRDIAPKPDAKRVNHEGTKDTKDFTKKPLRTAWVTDLDTNLL